MPKVQTSPPDGSMRAHHVPWHRTLNFRFLIYQFLLLALVVCATLAVILFVERAFLLEQGQELAHQLGMRAVSRIETRVALAEALATSLAKFGETARLDEDVFRGAVPRFLDYEGEGHFIAGGGIWPEPGAFTPGVERRSFFWGRDRDGTLVYFEDYNRSESPGYHHEEWYVPGAFCRPGQVFWSRSYVDPYSGQPMVTCTAPYWRDGRFAGVATVDLKLEGLSAFFAEVARSVKGYIFAVDRNNRLLSFPDPAMGRAPADSASGPQGMRLMDDLAGAYPDYGPLTGELGLLNHELKSTLADQGREVQFLVESIDQQSYQIDRDEAELVAAMLAGGRADSGQAAPSRHLILDSDPLLGQEAMVSIYTMPRTQWKVVVVAPKSRFTGVADAVTRRVALYVLGIEVLALLVMVVVLRGTIVRPIVQLARQVRASAPLDEGDSGRLDDSAGHELGQLAYEFNRRTENLVAARNRLQKTNTRLQEEMEERLRAQEEARKLEEQLHQSRKMESIGTLAGGVAHDFNNLLTPIIVYTELLQLDMDPDNPDRDNLEQILKAAMQARDLTGQLLAFARKQVLAMHTVDLAEVVREAEPILQRSIREDIVLNIHDPGHPCPIKADISQMDQVLMNLVVNARDAMPGGGNIEVQVSEVDLDEEYTADHPEVQPGPHIQLAVSDTGQGMDAETLAKIFDPFFTTKEVGKGTGLGLATIHGIIKQHRGSVWVYSEPGHGTTFKIFFPLAGGGAAGGDRPGVVARAEEHAPASTHKGAHVMVVEDNEFVLGLVEQVLEREGYIVHSAASPLQALEMGGDPACPMDLLLTDVVMPELNGKELFSRMAELRPGLKVIFMSGYADNVIVHHGVLDEGVRFLQKPINRGALLDMVARTLEEPDPI